MENFAEGFRREAFQLMLELKPNDLSQHKIFDEWAPGKLAEDPHFLIEKLCSATKLNFGSMDT